MEIDTVKKKREDLFKSTLPYLQKAYELDPENMDVAKTLSGVYGALEMTAELCKTNHQYWEEAEIAIINSLKARIELWNGAHNEITLRQAQ